MLRIVFWLLVALFLYLNALSLSGCQSSWPLADSICRVPVTSPSVSTPAEVSIPRQPEVYSPSDAGGIGIGSNGRVGIDMGGGLILTDKGISVGFGL